VYALKSLEAIGRPDAEPAADEIRKVLASDDVAEVRRQAVPVLIKLDPASPATRAALVKAMTDPDPQVAQLALDVLVTKPLDAMQVDLLVKALEHADPAIRQKAQAALAKGPLTREHVKKFLPLLKGKNKEQQQLVLGLLAPLKAEAAPAVPDLVELLKSGPPDLQKPVFEVLKGVGTEGKDAGPVLLELLRGGATVPMKLEIAEFLVSSAAPEAKDAMKTVVGLLSVAPGAGGDVGAQKEMAVALLTKLGADAIPHLTEALEKQFSFVSLGTPAGQARGEARLTVIKMIGEIAGKKKIPGQTNGILLVLTRIQGTVGEAPAIIQAAKEARTAVQNAPN
jgi:HEAT repeat protein